MNLCVNEQLNPSSRQVVRVAVSRPLYQLFTYQWPQHLGAVNVGARVKVPFGSQCIAAIVIEAPYFFSEQSEPLPWESLKPVKEVISPTNNFENDIWKLCYWAHHYYHIPLGELLHAAVYGDFLQGSHRSKKTHGFPSRMQREDTLTEFQLTEQQQQCVKDLNEMRFNVREGGLPRVALLKGVTGSGKTEVYFELARKTLAESQSVLILVPEIALTPQIYHRFESGLQTSIALWHSGVSLARKRDQLEALRSGDLKVVIGVRSAVFAPLKNLGLIIVDEEHDVSFKQEERMRYHARDLAIVRAQFNHALVVLGSATPSLETQEQVRRQRYWMTCLPQRIAKSATPRLEVLDLKNEPLLNAIQTPFTCQAFDILKRTVAAQEQVMIYLNRRGFAAFLICQDCGATRGCPHCSVSLTVYKKRAHLKCHFCGYEEPLPDACPKCRGLRWKEVGSGTERLHEELMEQIPGLQVLRLDREEVRSIRRLNQILNDFRQGKAQVLIGTQMLVKGHDFPGVTLVIVILADALWQWPDFRSTERAYQVLKQVAGRAGRGVKLGQVLIQAYDIHHPTLQVMQGLRTEESFLEDERQLRMALSYPPFGRLVRFRFEHPSSKKAQQRAQMLLDYLQQVFAQEIQKSGQNAELWGVECLGPSEAFVKKVKKIYRWDVLLKARKIQQLQLVLQCSRAFSQARRWSFFVDVDPYGI